VLNEIDSHGSQSVTLHVKATKPVYTCPHCGYECDEMVGPGEVDGDVPAAMKRAAEYRSQQAAARVRAEALIVYFNAEATHKPKSV
jgi:hypothetical protein